MVKNIIEMSKKNPKELYIKYKKKYLNLKNMIGGGSTYHFSIDGIDMQPIDQYDDTEGLQAVLESKKLIEIGEGIYLDAIKSKVYVFEDGNTNEYDLKYDSSAGGGLSASGKTYYYMKSESRINLDDLSKHYKDFIKVGEQSYNLIPSITEHLERGRPEGTIAIYRDDDTEAQTERTADLGRYKKEYDEKLSGSHGRQEQDSAPASPVSASLQRLSLPSVPASPPKFPLPSALSELSRLRTGEEKLTFYIYTTGLGYSINKPVYINYGKGLSRRKDESVHFINKWENFLPLLLRILPGKFTRIIINHYDPFERDETSGEIRRKFIAELILKDGTHTEEDKIVTSNFYETGIDMSKLEHPHFVFDCAGVLDNNPERGLCIDTDQGWVPAEGICGMYCPYNTYKFPKRIIKYDKLHDKCITVYDVLVSKNKKFRNNYIIGNFQGEYEGRGYSDLMKEIIVLLYKFAREKYTDDKLQEKLDKIDEDYDKICFLLINILINIHVDNNFKIIIDSVSDRYFTILSRD